MSKYTIWMKNVKDGWIIQRNREEGEDELDEPTMAKRVECATPTVLTLSSLFSVGVLETEGTLEYDEEAETARIV